MIKLLALDLDGTLLNSNGKIPEENKSAIRKAEENGVLVTIATGRRFRDALPVAAEAGLNAPLITHNGALLKYADTLEAVAFSLIPAQTVPEILRIGRDFGGDALVSVDPQGKGLMLYENVHESNIPLQKYIAWSKRLHGDEAESGIRQVNNLETDLEQREVVHVSFSGGCAKMAELEAILIDELAGTANVLTTRYPALNFTLIDILPPDASKGTGVEKLASLNNLTKENVMVIGDNFNDLEMLEFAGTPVLMGNAAPELLENEKYHQTLSNDENGVAAAIEKFILKK